MPSSYYIARIPHQTGPKGYTLVKVGINCQNKTAEEYIPVRYYKGSTALLGLKFDIDMPSLEVQLEKPILCILKKRHTLCEIVCNKKEHFWVKD